MKINANRLAEILADLADTSSLEVEGCELEGVATFEAAGVLTTDAGFVLSLTNGAEFQITVVQSRRARKEEGDTVRCQDCKRRVPVEEAEEADGLYLCGRCLHQSLEGGEA